ncbi:hypothetical protein ABIA15_006491 [Sinorhizobium fredii]
MKMIDMARGTRRIGTRRSAIAAIIDQKPPSPMPRTTRATSSMVRLVANAASRLERISARVKLQSTSRRSNPRVMIAIVGAAMAPTTAVAVTACPAVPSLIPRSAAIGVSTLAGRNSAVTRPNTPSASEMTPAQAGSLRSSVASATRGTSMLVAMSVMRAISNDPGPG